MMTEERYLLVSSDDGDVRIVDEVNGKELYAYQVCDLLNANDRIIRDQFVLIDKLEKRIKECRKPLSDDDVRRLYGRLQEKEYRKHCSGNSSYTIDTSDNRVRL